MSSKQRAMYGVSRIDDEVHYTHAWRVSLRRRGTLYVKNFPDLKWGGKGKALQEAQRHRDGLLRKHRPLSRLEFASILRRHNQTGVVGVCRFSSGYRLKNGKMRYSWYWEAIWPTKMGESETVRYSVNKFGEKGAFEKACAARIKGLKQGRGVFWKCRG
jgi:hypothetical protein